MNPLNESEIKIALNSLHQWELVKGKLHREFVFDNFIQAFAFMTQVALVAERDQHHPEWSNVYKTVVVDLITHEAGGITIKDVRLAEFMDRIE